MPGCWGSAAACFPEGQFSSLSSHPIPLPGRPEDMEGAGRKKSCTKKSQQDQRGRGLGGRNTPLEGGGLNVTRAQCFFMVCLGD